MCHSKLLPNPSFGSILDRRFAGVNVGPDPSPVMVLHEIRYTDRCRPGNTHFTMHQYGCSPSQMRI
jgi:hypothetical protein